MFACVCPLCAHVTDWQLSPFLPYLLIFIYIFTFFFYSYYFSYISSSPSTSSSFSPFPPFFSYPLFLFFLIPFPPLHHLHTSHQFEVAVRRATGEPPVFPGTLLALKNLPHRFKWLRKSVHADTDTEVEEEVEKQLEGEAKIEDDGEMKELTARWRGSWIKILKHDILNPRSSS